MNKKDSSAHTMRIGIRPSESERPAARGEAAGLRRGLADSSFITRPPGDPDRSADYTKLLQSIYDGVLICDFKGRVIDYNHRALRFFPMPENDLTGVNVLDLISGADSSLLEAIRKNLENHRYTMIEAQCHGKGEATFFAEVAVNRIDLFGAGQFCFLFRDITIRKRAQAELEEAVARLESHDQARTQFVSNVSHELRTPLTSMIYAVQNMLRGVTGSISDRVRDYLEMLNGDCKRLLNTVNDILDIRSLETRDLRLSLVRIPLWRLVARSTESLRVHAEQKPLALTTQLEGEACFVECDPQKMERVLINIVGNAIKFTPEGGSVSVVMGRDPNDDGQVLLTVTDTGIGIPADAIDKVTVRYYTVGEQPSGSGLGLAIAKELVGLHDGSLDIARPIQGRNHGTAVSVRLPVAPAPTVLIADPHRADGDRMAAQVARQGYRVVRTFDGLDALTTARREEPDAIILDLAIKDVAGSEVILKLKADKATSRIPVIVVTAVHVNRSMAEILNSFAVPALPKPWDESKLLDRIVSAFYGQSAFRQIKMKVDAASHGGAR